MNKFDFILDETIIKPLITPQEILSDYIGVDVNELVTNKLALIFGGCLRDIVSKEYKTKPFNDIDIVTFNPDCNEIIKILTNAGYQQSIIKSDTLNLYASSHINEPITLTKHDRKIQLIRPRITRKPFEPSFSLLVEFIRNVDLSCCGLAYDWRTGYIKQILPDAVEHCNKKEFQITRGYLFNEQRTENRARTLIYRGWKYIMNGERGQHFANVLNNNLRQTFFTP